MGTGSVVRAARGLYALPDCSRDHLARAAVGGVLSCLDAAREQGLAVLRPEPLVHVRAARGTVRTWPGTVVHREGLPEDGGALGLAATLVSAARCAPFAVAVSLVDEVLRTGRCDAAELAAAGGVRDRAWQAVLAAADARAMSGIESFTRLELLAVFGPLGVEVEPQVRLRGVGSVDLLVDGWLVVEDDGYAFHADRTSYREDRRRNQALSAAGYVWVRFAFEHVVRSRGQVAEQVLEVWSRGRPPHWHDLRRP